jgi:uncharacterized protein (UPF0261 family)
MSKMTRAKSIAIIGTLDTKGDEIKYLKNEIEARGFNTITIDVGVLGEPLVKADITREEVAEAGGLSLIELLKGAEMGVDKERAVTIMSKGAAKIVQGLYEAGKIDGIIAVGGAIGTAIGTAAMKVLPYGVPKFMVSIILSGRLKQFVNSKDITFINCPIDILGLNFLTKKILSNSCAALIGVLMFEEPFEQPKNVVAITSLGVTTPAVLKAKEMIENLGFETMVYTIDTEGMNEFLENGLICGILDLTPYELVDLYITKKSSHADRLSIAYKAGIPQVIAPGGLDFIILPYSIENIPNKYKIRKLYKHSPFVTLVRINKREAILLGKMLAKKANESKGPIVIAIPLRGFSSLDKEGQPFHDKVIDGYFISSLKKNVQPHVRVLEIDAHIND